MARPKIKSRSHHSNAPLHTQPLSLPSVIFSNPPVCDMYKDYKDKVITVGQRSNQDHTKMLHTYTHNQFPQQIWTSHTTQILRYKPDKIFPAVQTTANHPDTMNESNTHTAFKGKG